MRIGCCRQPPNARPAAISVALLRLIALSFTLTLMLATALAVMDLFAWQCLNLDDCAARLGPFLLLTVLPRNVRTALSAVPLMIVIVVLWMLGREDLRVAGNPPPSPAVTKGDVPLQDKHILEQRLLGAAAACLPRDGVDGGTGRPHARGAGDATPRRRVRARSASVCWRPTACFWPSQWRSRPGIRRPHEAAEALIKLTPRLLKLRWISLALLVASLIWVAVTEADYPSAPTQLPGLRGAIYVMLGVQVGLLILLLVVRRALPGCRSSPPEGYTPTLGGLTAWFVALIGWLIGGGFSLGIGLWTAQILGTPVISTAAASGDRRRTDRPQWRRLCGSRKPRAHRRRAADRAPAVSRGGRRDRRAHRIALVVGVFVCRRVTGKTRRLY